MCQSRSNFLKANPQKFKLNERDEIINSGSSPINLDFKIKSSTKNSEKIWLPDNYCVNDYDILCGRDADCYNHMGNQLFRQ